MRQHEGTPHSGGKLQAEQGGAFDLIDNFLFQRGGTQPRQRIFRNLAGFHGGPDDQAIIVMHDLRAGGGGRIALPAAMQGVIHPSCPAGRESQ